jgi:hypothetical protein
MKATTLATLLLLLGAIGGLTGCVMEAGEDDAESEPTSASETRAASTTSAASPKENTARSVEVDPQGATPAANATSPPQATDPEPQPYWCGSFYCPRPNAAN